MDRERAVEEPRTGIERGRGRYRRLALGMLPSLLVVGVIGGWFVDWRYRLAHTEVPQFKSAGLSFFDDYLGVVHRLQSGVPALAPDCLALGADLASLLILADQLEDIQGCLDLMRPAMDDIAARTDTTVRKGQRSAAWAWSRIKDPGGRCSLVPPRTAGFDGLKSWADARGRLRRNPEANLPAPPPVPHKLGIPDFALNASQAVETATAWEAGLALVLHGEASEGLDILRLAQSYFSGSVGLSDSSTVASAPLQVVRFPDLQMPGDLASGLRSFALTHADPLWKALQPARWDEPEAPEGAPAELESFLRLQLAQAHARAGDAAWFREHRDLLATGPYLNHRWSRQLAAEVAAVDLPEPDGLTQVAEVAAGDASLPALLDRLARAARLNNASGSVRQCRLSALAMYAALNRPEALETIGTLGAPYGPIGRTLAMAYADSAYVDVVLAPWIQVASAEVSVAWQRPFALLRPRLLAGRALGLLQARAGNARGLPVSTVELLSLTSERYPWSTPRNGRTDGVSLSGYVPGLSTLREVLALVTRERQVLGDNVERNKILE